MAEILSTYRFKDSFTSLKDQDEFITTIGSPTFFCVGMIDIVNSTKIVSKLSPNQSSQFYEIFINFMAKIVHQFNGQVLKTMGDSLFFYFPDTRFSDRKFGFLSCLECGFSIISKNGVLKELLIRENLPELHYRISFDYGNVTMMTSPKWGLDLVGPTINTCAKINGICPIDEMVVGGDLYEIIKNFKEYNFKKQGHFSTDLKHPYSIFSVKRAK